MRLIPTTHSLAAALDVLNKVILPEVTSDEAKTYIGSLQAILTDLFRRQSSQIGFLQDALLQGETLLADILTTLEPSSRRNPPVPRLDRNFDDLAARHGELTNELFTLAERLVGEKNNDPNSSMLLRRAAKWEHDYYGGISTLPVDLPHIRLPEENSGGPLSEAFLRRLLIGKRGITRLGSLKRLTGGGGKQTYSCVVTYNDDSTETMVVRKEDAVPLIKRGAFRPHQEFALLQCLNCTDFPAPRVYEASEPVPGPDGIDGAICVMSLMPGTCPGTLLNSANRSFDESFLLQLASLHAKLHAIPLETFQPYIDKYEDSKVLTQTVTQRYRSALEHWWVYYTSVEHLESPYLVWLFDWMMKHVPDDERRPVVTHGDFNVHNLLEQDGQITAVLDWETADFGAPEQDLAYIQPLVSKHMPWDKFIAAYGAAGGREINPKHFAFCQAYSILRTTLAFNRTTLSIQKGWSNDLRFFLGELGYNALFMEMGLNYTSLPPESVAQLPTTNGVLDRESDTTVVAAAVPEGQTSTNQSSSSGKFHDTATGGQKLMIFGDEANNRQTPGPQPNWQESVVLVWWDECNKVGGFHRLGHEPNLPGGAKVTLWTHLITPEGVSKRTKYIPLRDADLLPGGGMGSGDDTCTHIFQDGLSKWTFTDPEHELSAFINHKDIGPNLSGFPQKGSMKSGFASHHFDVPGTISGSVTIKGKTYTINGWGIRDHAWGPRDWNKSILSHRWVVGTAGDALSFVGVTYHSYDDRMANFGWVVRNGVVTYAKDIDVLAYMEADGCVNRGGRVKYVLDSDEVLIFEHTPVEAKAAVAYHHGIPCVDRICSFKCSNGLAGFSNFETSNNIQAGERRPGLLVDGLMEDGFWTP
ncbi:hypothetical protein FOPE_10156 [Fonsecaea pedrosoi]|nr:hypothetical protein FOPE_10156 [Fonsecaea pedrosoi]